MKRELKPETRNGLFILLTVAAAVLLLWISRMPEQAGLFAKAAGYLRSALYVGLYGYWIVSIRRRILHRQTRRILMAIGFLAVFWLLVRAVKWYILTDPAAMRRCWYLYYFPMELIPTLLVLTALSIGTPEDWRLPRWVWGLLTVPLALALGVLTNDLHQQAFRFLTPVWNEDDILHGPVYWMAIGWDVLCAVTGLALLLRKCRLTRRRGFLALPLVPIGLSLLYTAAYLADLPIVKLLNDLAAIQCLLFVGTAECCIRCGLIRSNSSYDELFRISSLNAFITDDAYRTALSSLSCELPTEEQMRQTEKGPVPLGGGLRLSGAPIRGGHVLWTEDVSELTDVLAELEDVSERLESRHTVLQKEYETTRERQRTVEKNRLYNKLMTKLEAEVRRYAGLVEQLDAADDPTSCGRIVSRIAVVRTYIKRRANMIFLDESRESDAGREMDFCLEETMSALRLCGVQCRYGTDLAGTVPLSRFARCYEALYRTLMQTLDTLTLLHVSVSGENGELTLTMRFVCGGEPDFSFPGMEAERDGGEWVAAVTVRGGEDG